MFRVKLLTVMKCQIHPERNANGFLQVPNVNKYCNSHYYLIFFINIVSG